jgi:basic membrane protein A
MLKRRLSLIALLAAFVLVVAACGDDDAATTTAAPGTTAAPTTTAAPATTAAPTTTEAPPVTAPPMSGEGLLACMVSDQAGIDDDSFNETAWKGMERAKDELGVTVEFLESQDATEYRVNIDAFVQQGCDFIVTVGFLLADDTGAAAVDNPDFNFGIIDFPVYPDAPWLDASGNMVTNVRGMTYQTDQATFLAGYAAAGMSQTHVIGTFGGINIAPVSIFMEGFRNGAAFYDTVHGTETTVLGWDGADGLFTGNFESLEDGRAFGQNLLDEGADVILPVAGPVGLGTAAAVREFNAAGGEAAMVWVDADGCEVTDFCDLLIGSVLKNMDTSVFQTITNLVVLESLGNQYLGTLANDGVGFIGGGIDLPADLAAEVDALRLEIAAGNQSVAFPG